ncbi:MAG TPA: hypothetical protein VGF82_28845 [Terracidiphilus sp.]|jgi:hypothetical protein
MQSVLVIAVLATAALDGRGQAMPTTAGETLSGKRVVPAEAVRGRRAIFVAGFSHDSGMSCGPWMKAIRGDTALNGIAVYELAMLEKAPTIIRGVIKSGMRKGTTAEEQDEIVVMTKNQAEWAKYFDVGDDKDPYVLMLNVKGDVVWHGHGPAARLEPLLKDALKTSQDATGQR